MTQVDFIGDLPDQPPSRGILNGNTNSHKAELCLLLGRQVNKVPASVNAGTVQRVHEWRAAREKAVSVLKNPRSSEHELTQQVANMRRFEGQS